MPKSDIAETLKQARYRQSIEMATIDLLDLLMKLALDKARVLDLLYSDIEDFSFRAVENDYDV